MTGIRTFLDTAPVWVLATSVIAIAVGLSWLMEWAMFRF